MSDTPPTSKPTSKPMHKKRYVNGVMTPQGHVSFPHLVSPDTEGPYAKKKYHLTLIMDPKDIGKLKEAAEACAKMAFPKLDLKDVKLPFKDGSRQDGKKGGEKYAGKVYITIKSNNQPTAVDAALKPIECRQIHAGCIVRCRVAACSYLGTKTVVSESTGQEYEKEMPGVSFFFDAGFPDNPKAVVQKVAEGEHWGGTNEGEDFGDESEPNRFDQAAQNVTVVEDCDI